MVVSDGMNLQIDGYEIEEISQIDAIIDPLNMVVYDSLINALAAKCIINPQYSLSL